MKHSVDRSRGSMYRVSRAFFLRSVLVPFLIIAIMFVGVLHVATRKIRSQMAANMSEQASAEIGNVANVKVEGIRDEFDEIEGLTNVLARRMGIQLGGAAALDAEDLARLADSEDGDIYTVRDRADGGAAVSYAGHSLAGEAERRKIAGTLSLQDMMADVNAAMPLAASVHLTTYDSLRVVYPYVDMAERIPAVDFYAAADAEHDPARAIMWTEAYQDPAGRGLTVTAVAPIYDGDFLEGVVGIDVRMDALALAILSEAFPWQGYGVLIDGGGTILAMPSSGGADWGIAADEEGIEATLLEPEGLVLSRMEGQSELAARMADEPTGFMPVTLNGRAFVAGWQVVDETGWKLLVLAPESVMLGDVDRLMEDHTGIASWILGTLAVLLALLYVHLMRQSYRMSAMFNRPLARLRGIVESIGGGAFEQADPELDILEFEMTAKSILSMGMQLKDAYDNLLATQKDLQKREANLHAVVNAMDDIIVETTLEGEILNVFARDPAVRRYLSDSTKHVQDFLDAAQVRDGIPLVEEVLKTGKSRSTEYHSVGAGRVRWYLIRIQTTDSVRRTLVFTATDITERKAMERALQLAKEEAEKANGAKTAFLSSMSHELRTPLHAVLGFSQLIQMDRKAPLTPEQAECVEEIVKAGRHLLELINAVLDFAKIEAGKVQLSLEPVRLKDMMAEVIPMIRPIAEQYGVEVSRAPSDCSYDYMMVDPLRFKQVMINLITNAIKYNRENGKVAISCMREGDDILVSVADTGIGIPKEHLDHVFEPFFRVDAANGEVEGTGIGLVVVKQLMDRMNGEVTVKSEVGVGSTFVVRIPVAEVSAGILPAGDGEEVLQPAPDAGTARKVLYIEDNPANVTLVERIVSHIPGVRLLIANQGTIGIDLARAHLPDVILVDISLPDIDGFQVLKKLRQVDALSRTAVVAVSAYAMEADVARGLEAGFADYLTKPIDVKKFTDLLVRYLSGDGDGE